MTDKEKENISPQVVETLINTINSDFYETILDIAQGLFARIETNFQMLENQFDKNQIFNACLLNAFASIIIQTSPIKEGLMENYLRGLFSGEIKFIEQELH